METKEEYNNCPTLLEMFKKYNFDISLITYNSTCILNNDLQYYFIESRGDGNGEVVVSYLDYNKDKDIEHWMGCPTNYSISQLLKLKVVISTWNKYSWTNRIYVELDIAKKLYDILLHRSNTKIYM